ncbi:MAG: hypothetical protein K2X44_08765, partial [Magnetospirillum sp.]|nr:hypothetical protein [Magnetospirillum sp.]
MSRGFFMSAAADPVFQKAFRALMLREGGYVDHPADPGGATNMGITIPTMRQAAQQLGLDLDLDDDGDIDAADVAHLEADQAAEIYYGLWWVKYGYGRVKIEALAIKLFDQSVLMGAKQAHVCLQRALRAAWFQVSEDGMLGPDTMRAINAAEARSLIAAFRAECAGFYR